ncbi:MAG: DUF1440 domain-containing protein [Verrucomicrobiota bacterium]|nr:DUF1440 domain-containing protein [Verrucomicrobiota bacterium]
MKAEYLSSSQAPREIGLVKVIAIGFIGGLVASGVKSLCELIAPPRAPGVQSPLGNALDAMAMGLTGEAMPEAAKAIAEPAMHFLFGAGAGAVYAVLARKLPLATAGYGALFGFVFWLLLHEIALPLMGLSPTPAQMTLWEQGNELVTHIVFGVVLEFVRRTLVRKWE